MGYGAKTVDIYIFLEIQLSEWCQQNKKISSNIKASHINRIVHIDVIKGMIINLDFFNEVYRNKYFSPGVFIKNATALIDVFTKVIKQKLLIMQVYSFQLDITVTNEGLILQKTIIIKR